MYLCGLAATHLHRSKAESKASRGMEVGSKQAWLTTLSAAIAAAMEGPARLRDWDTAAKFTEPPT